MFKISLTGKLSKERFYLFNCLTQQEWKQKYFVRIKRGKILDWTHIFKHYSLLLKLIRSFTENKNCTVYKPRVRETNYWKHAIYKLYLTDRESVGERSMQGHHKKFEVVTNIEIMIYYWPISVYIWKLNGILLLTVSAFYELRLTNTPHRHVRIIRLFKSINSMDVDVLLIIVSIHASSG